MIPHRIVFVAAFLAAAALSPAQNASNAPLTTTPVRNGLYLISGAGANSLVRLTANGVILVDGKLPGNYEAVLFQIRRIVKEQPVRILITTNQHLDRAGNNQKFLAAGTGIVAQQNAAKYFSRGNEKGATPPVPTVTFDKEYSINLGGVPVQLLHFGSACTNGDTVVYFPALKVIAVGDLFTAGPPVPDFERGGSLVSWGAVLAQILKLDFDIAVPSSGPPVSRAGLAAYKTKLDELVSRAVGLARSGVPKDRFMAQLNTADSGWQFDFSGENLNRFYAEVSAAARP